MLDPHLRRLERHFDARFDILSAKLDSLMASSQNVLDAAQNAAQSSQNLTASVTALVDRVNQRPQGVLTQSEADTVVASLDTISTNFQSAVDQLNAILPAA